MVNNKWHVWSPIARQKGKNRKTWKFWWFPLNCLHVPITMKLINLITLYCNWWQNTMFFQNTMIVLIHKQWLQLHSITMHVLINVSFTVVIQMLQNNGCILLYNSFKAPTSTDSWQFMSKPIELYTTVIKVTKKNMQWFHWKLNVTMYHKKSSNFD